VPFPCISLTFSLLFAPSMPIPCLFSVFPLSSPCLRSQGHHRHSPPPHSMPPIDKAVASRAHVTVLCSPSPILYIQPCPIPLQSNVAGLLLVVVASHPPASLPSPNDLQAPLSTTGRDSNNDDVLQTPQLPWPVFPYLLFRHESPTSAAAIRRHHHPSFPSCLIWLICVGRWKPKSHGS